MTIPVCEMKKSIEETVDEKKEGLVLKQLPDHLRYALSQAEEEKLIEVLQRHKGALAWSISDIKRISPMICMHKILLEECYKPTIENQRRLNPTMKEVV